MIPHSECIEEIWLAAPTQYVMSGSTCGISREKGGVQVREMMESSGMGVAFREPTAERRPIVEKKCYAATLKGEQR